MIEWRLWIDDHGWRAGLFSSGGGPAADPGPVRPTPSEALDACEGELMVEAYFYADANTLQAIAAAGIEPDGCREPTSGPSGPYLLRPDAVGVLAALGARVEVTRALEPRVPERFTVTEDQARRFVDQLTEPAPEQSAT